MTTYICKCGKTFQKNTEAGTTGFRMPDYGPDHECFGCPFAQTEQWREDGKDVDVYACRGSKVLDYQTDAYSCDSKGAALHVRTLDLKFIQEFFKDYLTLPGHICEQLYHGMDSPENGRQQYSFSFAANKQGDADRKEIVDRYFKSEGEQPGSLPSGAERLVRKDITPEQEKEIVLNQIKEAKALAQGIETPEGTGKTYYHNGLVFFADQREESEKFTVFADDADHPCSSTRTEVATMPDFDTFQEAQDALDGLALKRGFSAERSTEGTEPEMEQQTNGDIPEENSEAVPGPEDDLKMELVDDAPEVEPKDGNNDTSESDNENPPSDNDSGDSESGGGEQPPQTCDWKNASGEDEDVPEENDKPEFPVGSPLSLHDHTFDKILDAADAALNSLIRQLHDKKQHDGELSIKISFADCGAGAIDFDSQIGGKINFSLKATKVSLDENVQIVFDESGNPIIPTDREHQLNFDEIQPGQREYPPSGGTAKVDGKTGIVEDYQQDEEGPEDPPTSDDVTNSVVGDDLDADEKSNELYPCKNTECPFYAYDAGNPDASGCAFNEFDPAKGERDPFDMTEAVEQNGCTRPEVLQVYADNQPGDDSESEDHSDDEC